MSTVPVVVLLRKGAKGSGKTNLTRRSSSFSMGIDWSVICAATLLTAAPLLIAFLLFQRQFVQSFLRAGIR